MEGEGIIALTAAGGAQRITLPTTNRFLKGRVELCVKRLMAVYLGQLEELADQHDENMGRLVDALPPAEKVKAMLADSYGDTRFGAIRKHVLDQGNDVIRELHEQIDALRIQ